MKRILVAACIALGLPGIPNAWAQGYPAKMIRLITPYPPGGGIDASARIIGQALAEQLGHAVIVDNRAGATGRPAFLDLVGGKVDAMFTTFSSSLQYIQAGRVKALAVTSRNRVALAPELPTVAEAGLPGYEFSAWYGMVAPARVPPDIMIKLHREINDLLRNPEFRDAMMAGGAVPTGGSRDQFAEFIQRETQKYAAVIKASGIRAE